MKGKQLGLILMMVLLALSGAASRGQVQSGVQTSITAPTDGFITFDPTLKVQGTAQVSAGAKLDLVLVSVNGKAQKATLKADGSFEAEVELEYFGENIVSATVVTDNKQVGSARVSVHLQRRVLFFDDFEAGRPRPEWAPASGTWVVQKDAQFGWIYTIAESDWNQPVFTYITTPGSRSWRNYAVEVSIVNGRGRSGGNQGIGIVVRAQDDLNKVLLEVKSDRWLCWRIIQAGQWSDCQGKVAPGLTDASVILRVEARDSTFVAYINGIERTRWEDLNKKFTQGMPGLYVYYKEGAFFDNFKVESLEARAQSALAAVKEAPPIPDWELIRTQLAQLEPRLQQLDSRLNALQSAVGQVSKDLPKLQVSVTPSDLNALSQKMEGVEQLLEAWGQDKRVETLQALLGEQISKIKRLGDAVERMTEEFGPLKQRVESAAAKAESVDGKATLGLLLGAAGAGLALLVVLGILK